MNSDLVQFLRANIGDTLWFATPGGVVSGELSDFDEDAHTFGLLGAVLLNGTATLDLGDTTVSADTVSAWGDGTPTLSDDPET